LHTKVYQDIINGGGFGLDDARASIQIVHDIRNAIPKKDPNRLHPFMNIR